MTPTEQIKLKIDIVELVGETVQLRPAGRIFKANCPFHSERTPSFIVSPDRQSWRCFGACSDGGDVFSFVMRRDGVEFGEALRSLAERAGVQLPARQGSRQQAGLQDRLQSLNREAAMFFHRSLTESDEAGGARAYVAKRGLDPETVQEYRLGYSPNGNAELHRHMTGAGYGEQELVESGLFRKRDDGSVFPFFRARLMVPIQDARGDYLGFGARALDNEGPKYINSPQSALFDKSAVLYGLHKAGEAIKQEGLAVIVEGYMDVLTAHRSGFRNVVASMGTALTEKQVTTLKRLASRFVLALDADSAGNEATLRSLESAWRVLDRPAAAPHRGAGLTAPDTGRDVTLGIMDLPQGKDPDELILESPAEWRRLVQEATPLIDYVFQAVARRFDIGTARGKDAITQRLGGFIHQAPGIFEQNDRVKKLAHLLKEDENVIRSALVRPARLGGKRGQAAGSRGQAFVTGDAPRQDSREVYCVATILQYPEHLQQTQGLSAEHFHSTPLKVIYESLSVGVPAEELREHLSEELDEELSALSGYHVPPGYREREHGMEQAILRLQQREIDLEDEALSEAYGAGVLSLEEGSAQAEQLKLRRIQSEWRGR